jgi:AcrR family transcriptional regulator
MKVNPDMKVEPATNKPLPSKSERTRDRILEAALAVFRERGFANAAMREIAARAEVAVGAAYYYFDSKDAIVMAFYERAQNEIGPTTIAMLAKSKTLEARLRGIVVHKLEYFSPNRSLMGALSAHIDPHHPLSPFSSNTASIREQDIAHYERAIADSAVKLPRRVKPYLPRLLWLYQMGIILYWLYDDSPQQRRTVVLLDKSLQMLLIALRFANLPLFAPVHRLAADLLDTVYSDGAKTAEAVQ